MVNIVEYFYIFCSVFLLLVCYVYFIQQIFLNMQGTVLVAGPACYVVLSLWSEDSHFKEKTWDNT